MSALGSGGRVRVQTKPGFLTAASACRPRVAPVLMSVCVSGNEEVGSKGAPKNSSELPPTGMMSCPAFRAAQTPATLPQALLRHPLCSAPSPPSLLVQNTRRLSREHSLVLEGQELRLGRGSLGIRSPSSLSPNCSSCYNTVLATEGLVLVGGQPRAPSQC